MGRATSVRPSPVRPAWESGSKKWPGLGRTDVWNTGNVLRHMAPIDAAIVAAIKELKESDGER